MKRAAVVLAVLALVLGPVFLWGNRTTGTVASQALAQPASPPGSPDPDALSSDSGWRGRPPLGVLRRRLNLTDDQVRRLQDIFTAHRDRTERLRIALARVRLDIREALLEQRPDPSRLDSLARRAGELQGQLLRERLQLQLEVRQVLTPEQRAELRQLMREWPARKRPRGPGWRR